MSSAASTAVVVEMFEPADEEAPRRVPVEVAKSRGGKWVQLGDEEYRIPPLGFAQIQELQDDVASLAKMSARPTPAQMAVVARIVHAAVQRNYPSVTPEDITDMLDLGNYQAVLSAVLAIAGFEKAADGSGEARAALTGTPPTAA